MNAPNDSGQNQVQLTIDDIRGVVGSMVIESIIKDKKIAELTAQVEQLKKELGNAHTEK
jgi:hypothetical protein